MASVGWKLQLDGDVESAEQLGTRGVETATVTGDGTHTLDTRVHDVAGNVSVWRAETIKIDTVKPTDDTVYPSAPVGNRHMITFAPNDARSGVAGDRWKLDDGAVKTTATATIVGDGAHTLDRAREGQRRQLERLGRPLDHRQPRASTPTRRPTPPSSRPSGAPAPTP